MTVAALFVDADGVYSGRPDVDLWPESRDARTYAGPWPVVAHPPCETWGRLWKSSRVGRAGGARGDDGGCASAAVASVRRWGGVLEHPASSRLFAAHGIPMPHRGGGWTGTLCGGWVCEVFQGAYGHAAPKRTWLYYVGPPPPALDWREVDPGGRIRNRAGSKKGHAWARHTPGPFADLLLELATAAGAERHGPRSLSFSI